MKIVAFSGDFDSFIYYFLLTILASKVPSVGSISAFSHH